MIQQKIKIILVETYHPGNIGAAARAMKTMGLSDLVLVNPSEFLHPESLRRAAGGKDVLESANITYSLEDAIADCQLVFATSARLQHEFSRPQMACEQAVKWLKDNPQSQVGIIFGPERTGLSAKHIQMAQKHIYIPSSDEYGVLNIAAAVQIVCYEIFKQLNTSQADNNLVIQADKSNLPSQQTLNGLYDNLQTLLTERGYIREEQPTDTMNKIKSLFNKRELQASEVSMLHGIFKALTRPAKSDDTD